MSKAVPLTRAQAHNAVRRFADTLPSPIKLLTENLLALLDDAGGATVHAVHAALFPMAATKAATAQLSKLTKQIEQHATRLGLKIAYSDAESGAAGQGRIFFVAPAPTPRADTEGLDAIPASQRITGQLSTPLDAPRILLLTFNDNEFRAVRAHFWPNGNANAPPVCKTGDEAVDDLGFVNGWHVLHGHSRQGSRETQRCADLLRRAHTPEAIIAVGIAFGIEGKQKIGDVLVSQYIVDYEHAKVGVGVKLRGGRPVATRMLVFGLEQLDIREKTAPKVWPRLHFGGILSGEKLIDNLDYRDSLLKIVQQDDVIGGEMEAAGLFVALDGGSTGWVVVKAICDFADGHKHVDKERRQQLAASNAASVVYALLQSPFLPCPRAADVLTGSAPCDGKPAVIALSARDRLKYDARALCVDGPYVERQLANSLTLSNLAELDINHRQPVVAFDHILEWLNDAGAPPLYALLGEYGMGKTTHCQTLTRHLEELHAAGTATPAPLYFDLRKVEHIAAGNQATGVQGHVASLEETIHDCLRNGYLQSGTQAHCYQDVLDVIDDGALVIFDGLDEVLSRLGDAQGMTFTGNLLKVLPEARQRQTAAGHAGEALRLPKVLLSCRTQFFRNLAEQNSHFTGEHRGAQPASQYRASVLQAFSDEQVETYLQAVFPTQDVAVLMKQIASIHNLRELAGRPFTLKLVAQFMPRIQSWREQGRTITGATLYREVAREWLIRDKEKQSFQPQEKERLAGDLAAHLWRTGQRGIGAMDLETWLDAWLDQLPSNATVRQLPRGLLQQDVRNATFLKRRDAEKPEDSRFEYAHTSLQEFFLADYLFRVLRQASQRRDSSARACADLRAQWALARVSNETLDFFGQILAEAGAQGAELRVLSAWRTPYLALASELQLAYVLRAHQRGWPMPTTVDSDFSNAELAEWHIGCLDEPGVAVRDAGQAPLPMLDLSGCRFAGANLRRTRFWRVRLEDADFTGASLAQAELLDCRCENANWQDSECDGMVARASHGVTLAHAGAGALPVSGVGAVACLDLVCTGGHRDAVRCCAFSPDGRTLISGSDDGTLKLWDTKSGACLRNFVGHGDWVQCCAFLPDGRQLISGSKDATLRLWDSHSGVCLRRFVEHTGAVMCCAVTADGRQLLSGSEDKTLKCWDIQSASCLLSFSGHDGVVYGCAISGDGRHVLSGSSDRTLKLWDGQTGACLRSFDDHGGEVNACEFSTDARRIVSGADGLLKLRDAENGECLRDFVGHFGQVFCCAWSSDAGTLLSGGTDGTPRLWNTRSGECLLRLVGHGSLVWACASSPDGKQLLSGSEDAELRLWDSQTGVCLRRFAQDENHLTSCAITRDARYLLAALYGGGNMLWDTEHGCYLHSLGGVATLGADVRCCALSNDGLHALFVLHDDRLHLFDTRTATEPCRVQQPKSRVICCAFSPNGLRLVCGHDDGNLTLWNAQTGMCLREFSGHRHWVSCCASSPDARQLLSGADDGKLKLWDANSGACLHDLEPDGSEVLCCAFSTDGRQLLAGTGNGLLTLWNAQTGECLQRLSGHAGPVLCCALSSDGARLISASDDGSVKLWDVEKGQCLHSFVTETGQVMSCAFAANDAQVLACTEDGNIYLWDGASGRCLRRCLTMRQGVAAWEPESGKVLHASGRVWRNLAWRGLDAEGNPCVYPFDSVAGVEVLPWAGD